MNPALADERDVADHARRSETGQVSHDVVLQLLRLENGQAPMLGIRDHVAHIEVIGHDRGVVEEHETQIEQLLGRSIDAAQQNALITHVAKADFQQLARSTAHQRSHLAGMIGVRVEGQTYAALARLQRQTLQTAHHFVLQEMLRNSDEPLGREADVADVLNVQEGANERLQHLDGHVGDVAAGDHYVAHRRGAAQVIQNLLPAVFLRDLKT